MNLSKRFLKSDVGLKIIAFIASLYIRFVYYTSRWQHINHDIPQQYWKKGDTFICAVWHNRLLMVICGWNKSTPINMLISNHSDGKLIAKAMAFFNVKVTPGSTGKKGLQALRTLLKTLKTTCVGITPDGPRGPRFQVSDGIITLAKLSGKPIIPGTYSIKRRRVFNSWDKFIVALPFSRGVFVWGKFSSSACSWPC